MSRLPRKRLNTTQRQALYDREVAKAREAVSFLYRHHFWMRRHLRMMARDIARLPLRVIK